MRLLKILLTLLLFISVVDVIAQGCSDAGVCTMGAPHYNTADTTNSTTTDAAFIYRFTQSVGLGEQNVLHVLSVAEVNYRMNNLLSFQFKVPYLLNFGNLANTNGLGDLSISATINKSINTKSSVHTIIGFKLPVNNATLSINAKPLPMPYQTSLATFDGILGVIYQYKNWNFTTAYQRVLSSNNQNEFISTSAAWNTNADAANYFNSYKFLRGDDAILKAERNIKINNNWTLSPSILAIYRIQKDQVQDPVTTLYSDLPNSDGLTLNIITNASYKINASNSIDFGIAFPLIVRTVRADGLTRSMIASLSYRFSL